MNHFGEIDAKRGLNLGDICANKSEPMFRLEPLNNCSIKQVDGGSQASHCWSGCLHIHKGRELV